ncbi:glutathione peroxidase [Owenweeksia hongkongensis DSM 17368]|uniref:Glutathione peroxidase n=1 Tax=Owenweeksia hongkongensis (strain DSM 17368 / CIP 108786 / JCM 12287 / NRRL B-23963 / UST20020801) TaxID=926562 RepID=G8QZ81_OWEHD|nr:glutathione peroxidase [Owenweeksia hongkongensis]AEV31464.1 glutathione peroxidase [Owenweeksia hongkongensis DSM 17368]
MNFYDLEALTPSGKPIKMSDYKGKVVLIVNTATQCGLTPQFEGLEKLHQQYKGQGLVVLGFPCNQFGGQEPLSNDEMESTCQVNHGVSFQLTEKVDVNGPGTHPVFKYLKSKFWSILGRSIKWNFTKFLVGPDGKPYQRYAPTTKPEKLEKDILKLLKTTKATA